MIKRFFHIPAVLSAGAALALALLATTPPADWKIAGPFGGTALTIAIDPKESSVVLAGAMSSLLFQSRDAGTNWSLLDFPKRTLSEVTTILIDPEDSTHYLAGMIAADGGGLFESHDRGKSWAAVDGVRDFGVRALAAAPSKPSRFVAGTMHGLMLSDDSGKTWTRISDPQNLEMQAISAVAVDSKDPDIIYAGTSHLPWKTTDGGKTWQSIHTGMIDDSDVFSIYVDTSEPSDVLASACSGIYASNDRGDLWHKLLGIPNTSRRTHVVREDPLSGSTIYAGTTTGLFRSLNRGTTWKTLTDTQVNHLAFDPAHPQNMYLALEYEGIGKSINGGDQINLINHGFVDRVISWVTVSGDNFVAIETQEGETTGIFVSSDRGQSWVQLRATRGLAGVHLKTISGSTTDPHILLAASPHQMYKSADAGANWKPLPIRLIVSPPPETQKKAPPTPTRGAVRGKPVPRTGVARTVRPQPKIKEISPSEISGIYALKSGPKDLFFAATDLGLLRSDDAGEHWTLAEMPGTTAVTALYIGPPASDYLVARTAGGLFLSKDCGDHWSPVPFPLPASDLNDLAIPADDSAPFLAATRVGLYSSSDGGNRWTPNRDGLPASTVSSVVYAGSPHTAFAIEYGRLYQTTDSGNAWSELSSALPVLRIRQLWVPQRDSKRLYGITSELGIIFRD